LNEEIAINTDKQPMPLHYTADLEKVTQQTHDVKTLHFTMVSPPRIGFVAGQFISIEITETKDGRRRTNNRAYSIASAPEEAEQIDLCVNWVRGGPGSNYLHSLCLGDRISFLPPMGDFTVKPVGHALVFVATGVGIAPIRSMIRHRLAANDPRPMILLWGLRREEDIYYQEEFSEMEKRHPQFRSVTTLSKPSSGWTGARGRVTDLLPEHVKEISDVQVYLCGSGAMIRDARILLQEGGLPKSAIHYERFF